MATILKSIVAFANVAAGAQSTLAHGLNLDGTAVVPDKIEFDNGSFSFVAATAATITVQNDGLAAANLNVLVEHWHTFERVFGSSGTTALTPQPFVVAGEGSGVTNPLILATGDAVVTAPAAYASAAIGHSPAGGVTPNIRVGAAGSGFVAGWATGYPGSALDITAGGRGSMAVGYIGSPLATAAANVGIHASGYGSFAHGKLGAYGGYNSYLEATAFGAHAHGFSYATGALTRVRATNVGATAMGYAHGITGAADILASGYGSLAAGYAANAAISSTQRGSLATGFAASTGAIQSYGDGAAAVGAASGFGSTVSAQQDGALALGSAACSNGLGSADIIASGFGSVAMGRARSDSRIALIESTSFGSFAMGSAESFFGSGASARIIANDPGSIAMGRALANTAAANIYADSGGIAFGVIYRAGTVSADDSFSAGRTYRGTISSSYGGTALGRVENGTVNAPGGIALGYANGTGTINGGNVAVPGPGISMGYASGGTINSQVGVALGASIGGDLAAGWAGVSMGYAAAGNIYSYAGGVAAGYSWGDLTADGFGGAIAMGHSGYGATLHAYNYGSIALGCARYDTSAGTIYSDGWGSIAMGYAVDGGSILASSQGSFAAGHANTYDIVSSGYGSGAFGAALTAAVQATANNAFQFGEGTNAVANSLQVGLGFQARSTGQTGSKNQAVTLGVGATTFASLSNFMTITGDGGGNTVATITGGFEGQELTLLFVDALVTITNDDTHGANSIDLVGGANFVSADDSVLKLLYDGTSWYEVSRSVN